MKTTVKCPECKSELTPKEQDDNKCMWCGWHEFTEEQQEAEAKWNALDERIKFEKENN